MSIEIKIFLLVCCSFAAGMVCLLAIITWFRLETHYEMGVPYPIKPAKADKIQFIVCIVVFIGLAIAGYFLSHFIVAQLPK